MSWHDGLVFTWHFRVVGSSLGESKLNFIFGCFGFGLEFEGLKETQMDTAGSQEWLKNRS